MSEVSWSCLVTKQRNATAVPMRPTSPAFKHTHSDIQIDRDVAVQLLAASSLPVIGEVSFRLSQCCIAARS